MAFRLPLPLGQISGHTQSRLMGLQIRSLEKVSSLWTIATLQSYYEKKSAEDEP